MAIISAAASSRVTGEERVLAFLRAQAPTDRVSVNISTGARQSWGSLRPTADLLRAQAAAAGCRVAVAETGGIASHWIDAIVWGTAADVECFVVALSPALAASGRRSRHRVGAIVAA